MLNNYLTAKQITELAQKIAECWKNQNSGCIQQELNQAIKQSDQNSDAMRSCKTRECLDGHMQKITEAASVYGQIRRLEQAGVDTAGLAFGNSKTPLETDTRYYLDIIRQNPDLQTPYERQFYAMDNAKRAGFEELLFGHTLSEQERFALLAGASGNPVQTLLADAATNYAAGLGINNQQLAILAVGVGSLKGVVSPIKGSPIPVPEKTIASNGLAYQSNPKHTAGGIGNRPNAGIEPKDSLELFEKSIPDSKGNRYAIDSAGSVHRFFSDKAGSYHWSGSMNQGNNSLTGNDIPNEIKNAFKLPKKGW